MKPPQKSAACDLPRPPSFRVATTLSLGHRRAGLAFIPQDAA
jgi:hypothetical protein